MRIAAQTRARHWRERDEESHGITTSRKHHSLSFSLSARPAGKEKETEGRRRKSVETPAVTYARALRHLDTSDSSSSSTTTTTTSSFSSFFFFSSVTFPNPRFSPRASVPPLFAPLAHTLHTHSRTTKPRRLFTEGASRTDSIVVAAMRPRASVREHSFPRGDAPSTRDEV